MAPSFIYALAYTAFFTVNIVIVISRHQHDERGDFIVIWLLMGIFINVFWFIFQKRELKRFYERFDAEKSR